MKTEKKFEPFLVAVYGTLKKGFRNNGVLGNSELVGVDYTPEHFTMYDTNCGFPAVVQNGDSSITVEVYKITSESVAINLDMLEGFPRMYGKTEINTICGKAIIYTYNCDVSQMRVIESGTWDLVRLN